MDEEKLIFTERPYAAVLYDHNVPSYCSTCFSKEPKFPCQNGCEFANYCDEKCSSEDWPWHQFECAAFVKYKQENQSPEIETRCRMVGRLLARFHQDQGIASLSEGLPDFVKDRKFGDLLSHYHEIRKVPKRMSYVHGVCRQFFKFYGSTALKDTPAKTVRIFLCTFQINSFVIVHGSEMLGLGLYINASRFNHSCASTSAARFKGCNIQIRARNNVHQDEYNTEGRFNRLTVNYGATPFVSRCYYLTFASQRVHSLKLRYFFRCLCSECVDSTSNLIEERAAAKECGECGMPYIWTENGQLRQMCKCEVPVPNVSPKEHRKALKLERTWKKIMDKTDKLLPARSIIDICQPFVEKAHGIWHPSKNLRLALVVERLGVACVEMYTLEPDLLDPSGKIAQSIFALAEQYARSEWGQAIAAQYRAVGELWEKRRTCPEVSDGKPVKTVDAADSAMACLLYDDCTCRE